MLDIHFYTWKYSKFIFMRMEQWFILVCKILESWAKANNLCSPSTFLEERHPEDTKNPFFWSPEVSRKFISFDRLLNILMLKRYH